MTSDPQIVAKAKGVPTVSAKFQIKIRKTVGENPLSLDTIFGDGGNTYYRTMKDLSEPQIVSGARKKTFLRLDEEQGLCDIGAPRGRRPIAPTTYG